MTTLDPDVRHVVLINTFRPKPGQADALVELLRQATEQGIRHVPGFISANLHVSLDRTKVVNYAQWRSKEDFEAMLASDSFKAHKSEIEQLIDGFEPVLYELRYSHAEAGQPAVA